ncbi:pdgfa associated protein 1b [Synchiropus splendidus]|uniref:pdgfa associated protein 1b n=1 Tax=Synchiropus splendidus TaxID=270530 RepID=UPI00237E75DD|nr:pdgfa associated protein 1b [Synchiropus splendidus]
MFLINCVFIVFVVRHIFEQPSVVFESSAAVRSFTTLILIVLPAFTLQADNPTTSSFKMPKGGRRSGHKGRMRTYTSPEEIDAQMKAEKEKRRDDEEDGAADNDGGGAKLPGSGSDDSDDDGSTRKRAGVEGLIQIDNPNRVVQKSKKVTQIELDEPRQLSRREREEIEKQKAKERYMKLHLAGKTDQAKADLARLAIIRKQREEAAKKKEEEKKAKEAAAAAAMAARGVQSLSLK